MALAALGAGAAPWPRGSRTSRCLPRSASGRCASARWEDERSGSESSSHTRRAPAIRGLGTLPSGDQPQRRLPTAHACFNHLLLPRYDNEETLQGRFATAMKNTEKFGLQ